MNNLWTKGKNDECLTPEYAVEPLLKYIPKGVIVWCPFDKEDSNFVRLIKKQNKVVFTHIDNGEDYYSTEPKHWDVMISNPPFTNKRLIFERALKFNKPFALLMTNTWLNDAAPMRLFKDKDLELLMFDKRIRFKNKGVVNNKITFSSSYYCYNFLPKQIMMSTILINKKD